MPSGPKKRHAARRRSMGRPGTRTSLDKASVSDSLVSDEGTSPKTGEERSARLSLATGTNERPSDQTFQTEEWVRVSDFDVGTPTSTTAKSDFDSIGDARGHDKLAEWETVSRENAGNSSSGEGDRLAAEESSGSGRKSPRVDVVLSGSDDDDKSVSSRSTGGKSSRSSSTSSSSRSAGSRSDAYPKKSDDEERSSSIVVVPSYREHEDDSQESSYVEVGSVGAREDDYHGSVATLSSPDGKEGDYRASSSAIEPASSEDNYEHFSGVEDHASSAIEPASSEEQEEEKYRLFTDLSNVKDLEDLLSGSDAVDLSSLIRFQSGEEEHQSPGHLKTEDVIPMPELTPEMNKSSHEIIDSAAASDPYPQSHPPGRNVEEDASVAEEATLIEPTTPEKTSEKSFAENPYTFVRSVSDEEILESSKASPLDVEETAPTPSLPEAQGGEENVAKEVHDSSFSGSVPEPNLEELKELLEIAHSKEIAALGKQEEKILAQEEQELGKGIVEPQPLVEVLLATDPSKPLEGGEVKDFQPVVAEEAPLLKAFSSPVDSDSHHTTELKDRVADLFANQSGEEVPESQGGVHQTAGVSLMDDDAVSAAGEFAEKEQRSDETGGSDSFPTVDPSETEAIPTENLKEALVPLSTLTDPEWPKCSAESTKDVGAAFESENNMDPTGKIAGSSEKNEQITYQRREDQPRILGPIQASSDTWGCCEPVQWLFANFRGWVNPRAIRN